LCERFKCLPSALEEEDAGLIRLLEIVRLGTNDKQQEEVE